ncbi:MAG: 3-deoxy-7-phosphoheptulonate synthase [Fimbriimonadaceae bacterium]|nr:3-deoxy-7-phosphoheptulonate synthase [Fimbriimonadaceae bacterium]
MDHRSATRGKQTNRVDDVRIDATRPLVSPAILMEEVPNSESNTAFLAQSRETARAIVSGEDRRLLVVVGPCSIHDPVAARDYAEWLKERADRYADKLFVVMRTYFEKPRSTVGWKGFINDPELDGSHRINRGLREARTLLRDVADLGLPCATEFLDMIAPQYIADFVTWGAIGARTVESQPHRELASGLSMPVGFKNGTDGRISSAVEGVIAAREPHWFASATKDGVAAHFRSTGNDTCHIILRGGSKTGPNYGASHVADACRALGKAGLAERVMIDCSHANSGKDPARQPEVLADVVGQIKSGSRAVLGVMVESNLVAGRQDVVEGQTLVYGQSITDGCVGLDTTDAMLESLASAK